MTPTIKPNQTVTTPNGDATVIAGWHNPADPHGEYVLVRHPKKQDIDRSLAAWTPTTANGTNGWLAAYRLDEVTG